MFLLVLVPVLETARPFPRVARAEMESSPVLSSRIFLDIGKMANTSPLTIVAHPACEMLKKPLLALAAPRPHCTTTCPVLGTHPVQGLQGRVHAQGPRLCYIRNWWGLRASVRTPASSIAKRLRNAQLEWLHTALLPLSLRQTWCASTRICASFSQLRLEGAWSGSAPMEASRLQRAGEGAWGQGHC